MVLRPYALQGLASGAAVAMGVEPAAHPDVAVFGVPELGQLHDTATAGTFERVVVKGGFDPLAPFEVLESLDQRLQIEQWGLDAEGVEGSVDEADLQSEGRVYV